MNQPKTLQRVTDLLFGRHRDQLNSFNPSRGITSALVNEKVQPVYTLFHYNGSELVEKTLPNEAACRHYRDHGDFVTWINVDGLNPKEVADLCEHFNVHSLLVEDILSVGQRAKMDEMGDIIFCIMHMLYYNEATKSVETEQVSLVLGKNFVLSFQIDKTRDVFDVVRNRLRNGNVNLRTSPADYLCYTLIDVIVDSYFDVIERVTNEIEKTEDNLINGHDAHALVDISCLRRQVMLLRHTIYPVREVLNYFVNSDNKLLEERHEKYYKDVRDHIIQANDYIENQRDMLSGMQDLYLNQVNLKMNEVMKILTLAALLMAPATVISGIFGMNFENMPFLKDKHGFGVAVGLMFFIPVLMIVYFKRKKWF